ncbi:VOC family protein [Enterococcus faecalis]
MKLDMVGIIVNDMTQALSFYQTLGFNVLGEASPDYTELQNNGVRISLNSLQMITGDNTVKKMSQAGYIVFKEPWNAPWGQRYAIIKDVDANLISLFAPL